MLSDEITKMAKSSNLFSHFGGKYKSIINFEPDDNLFNIDIKTIDGKWRLMKYDMLIYV